MTRARFRVAAAAALVAAAASGCGLGPGESTEGEATLTVTRDYGAAPVLEAEVSGPPESETVMKLLDREAEIETRYGGGFVQSIQGIGGGNEDGRSFDWFFYVNGIESEVGAADVSVLGGDRIWWDHRDWTSAMRVPAVVGSWPEPFLQESATERRPVVVECAGEQESCEMAHDALANESVESEIVDPGAATPGEELRLLVGPWDEIRSDPAARLLEREPAFSGVFARFADDSLMLLDQTAAPATAPGAGTGLVAATRDGEDVPIWFATGIDAEGVEAAVEALNEEDLRDRYAVASSGGDTIPLPVGEHAP